MRHFLSLVFAVGLLCAGLFVLYLEVFQARIVWGRMLIMGSFLIVVGGAWLWSDFLAPLFKSDRSV